MARKYINSNRIRVDGAKLTQARIDANMSAQDVATELRCNKSSISRWEQGTLIPSEERIMRMVMMFGRGDFVIKNENGGE
jgi:predicted transcriptional regulator